MMNLRDYLELTKLGIITFYHIVIKHHDMIFEEYENYTANIKCSCGYSRMMDEY